MDFSKWMSVDFDGTLFFTPTLLFSREGEKETLNCFEITGCGKIISNI